MSELKIKAAKAALDYIDDGMVVGVGTGSTVDCFIQELIKIKHRLDACVASSIRTENLLRAAGIPVLDLNSASDLAVYVDGADEVTSSGMMIKGGGGALTREKIVANVAKKFVCIVDESKLVSTLGTFPLAIEVIPIARSFVARELVALGGDPEYRAGFVTDNGNIILDVYHLAMDAPMMLEDTLNKIPGVVENGLFTHRLADTLLVASADGVVVIK